MSRELFDFFNSTADILTKYCERNNIPYVQDKIRLPRRFLFMSFQKLTFSNQYRFDVSFWTRDGLYEQKYFRNENKTDYNIFLRNYYGPFNKVSSLKKDPIIYSMFEKFCQISWKDKLNDVIPIIRESINENLIDIL